MDTPIHASTACSACGLPESAWKERPILFSGPMVRAILSGRKTQTRRVVKPQPTEEMVDDFHRIGGRSLAEFIAFRQGCPYGNRACRLWVRERMIFDPDQGWRYWADGADIVDQDYGKNTPSCPSIHMPRSCARILLEITAVRVERLNAISVSDAIAEGYDGSVDDSIDPSIKWYSRLWESINGAGSWTQNPWVWVVEFKDVSRV